MEIEPKSSGFIRAGLLSTSFRAAVRHPATDLLVDKPGESKSVKPIYLSCKTLAYRGNYGPLAVIETSAVE